MAEALYSPRRTYYGKLGVVIELRKQGCGHAHGRLAVGSSYIHFQTIHRRQWGLPSRRLPCAQEAATRAMKPTSGVCHWPDCRAVSRAGLQVPKRRPCRDTARNHRLPEADRGVRRRYRAGRWIHQWSFPRSGPRFGMIWHLLLSKRFAVYLFLINFAVAKMGNAIYASRKGYKFKKFF